MVNITKLNFYDTDAVKAFILDILVENQQVRKEVEFQSGRADAWFEDYRKEQKRAEAAEAKNVELEKTADALAAERDAALAQKGGVTE